MTRKRMIISGQHPREWDDGNPDPWHYGIILHEPRGPETTGLPSAPDVIKLDDQGYGIPRMGNPIPWKRWFPHCLKINEKNPGAAERILKFEADVFLDGGQGGDINPLEKVSALSQDFGGNLFAWDLQTIDRVRMRSWKYDGEIPDTNPETNPEMYRLVTVVNGAGDIFLPGKGVVQWMPRVAGITGELWIEKERVKFLPEKPKVWTIAHIRRTNEQIKNGFQPS